MFVYGVERELQAGLPDAPCNSVHKEGGATMKCERCAKKRDELSALNVRASVNVCRMCVVEMRAGESFYEYGAPLEGDGSSALTSVIVALAVIGTGIGCYFIGHHFGIQIGRLQ